MKSKLDFVFLYYPHPYEIDPASQIGLGLLLLATYAESLGASVKVLNFQSNRTLKAMSEIPKCKNLMLYGCIIDLPIITEVIEYAEDRADNIFLGGHISQGLKDYPGISLIVSGFGEDFVQDLINGGEYFSEFAKLRNNINHYPFPNRRLLGKEYGGSIFKNDKLKAEQSTTLLTSRGCKHKCAFCTSGSEKFYQKYSFERIERELDDCLSLGIKNIRISDDNLMSDRDRLINLCKLFKEAQINWRASVRAFPNGIGLYKMMKESGCKELSFGVESGDQKVLTILNKGLRVDQNTTAIKNANRAGIGVTRALMMMGTPGETQSTLDRNMDWVLDASPTMVSLKMFVPYPGTDVFEMPIDYGCRIRMSDLNNSAYRPDNSEPKANIDCFGTDMTQDALTKNFRQMRKFLEDLGLENRG